MNVFEYKPDEFELSNCPDAFFSARFKAFRSNWNACARLGYVAPKTRKTVSSQSHWFLYWGELAKFRNASSISASLLTMVHQP